MPHIDYCSLLLVGCSDENELALKKIVNSCIRFVFDLRLDAHISQYYIENEWLTPHFRRLFYLGKLTFNILKNQAPKYLADKLVLKSSLNLRCYHSSPLDLYVKNVRTNIGASAFSVAAPCFWNTIPIEIRSCESVASFSGKLYKYLFELQKSKLNTNSQ